MGSRQIFIFLTAAVFLLLFSQSTGMFLGEVVGSLPVGALPNSLFRTTFQDGFEDGTLSPFYTPFTPWIVTLDSKSSGLRSAKSGPTPNNDVSTLSLNFRVENPSIISFYRRVDTEQSYDLFSFYIDGSKMEEWSGNLPWAKVSYPINTGHHSVDWRYHKDESNSAGADAVWIDEVSIVEMSQAALADSTVCTQSTGVCPQSASNGLRAVEVRTHFFTYAGNTLTNGPPGWWLVVPPTLNSQSKLVSPPSDTESQSVSLLGTGPADGTWNIYFQAFNAGATYHAYRLELKFSDGTSCWSPVVSRPVATFGSVPWSANWIVNAHIKNGECEGMLVQAHVPASQISPEVLAHLRFFTNA